MDLVPAMPDLVPPQPTQPTALVPLVTTGLKRGGGELPPVCLLLSSSTLIGLRVYLEEFTRQLAAEHPSATTAATYLKRGRAFVTWLEQGRRRTTDGWIGPVSKRIVHGSISAFRIPGRRTGTWSPSANSSPFWPAIIPVS